MPIVRASRTVLPSRAVTAKCPSVARSAAASQRPTAAVTSSLDAPHSPVVRGPTRSMSRSTPSSILQPYILSAEEDQRLSGVFIAIRRDDLADDDPVIAAFVDAMGAASKSGNTAFEQRTAFPRHERERRRRRVRRPSTREVRREIALVPAQDADRKAGRRADMATGFGLFPEAEQ